MEIYVQHINFIRRIKVMNTNLVVSIFQFCVRSYFLNNERECKQGDPMAAYLFILFGYNRVCQ